MYSLEDLIMLPAWVIQQEEKRVKLKFSDGVTIDTAGHFESHLEVGWYVAGKDFLSQWLPRTRQGGKSLK
jgi:hypothetical protein